MGDAFRDSGALLEQIRRLEEENQRLLREVEELKERLAAAAEGGGENEHAVRRRLLDENDDLRRESRELREKVSVLNSDLRSATSQGATLQRGWAKVASGLDDVFGSFRRK